MKTGNQISCYWCSECFQHLACLSLGKDEESNKKMGEHLAKRIKEHSKVCSHELK